MIDPLFWLGLSILLVAISLTVFLIAALPALQEVGRAARSVEKLIETLRRELPPTLEAIRLTGMEISELTDDVSDGVKSAGHVVKQVDRSLESAKKQAQKVEVTTRSVFVGVRAAWKSLMRKTSSNLRPGDRSSLSQRRTQQSRLRQPPDEENSALELSLYPNSDSYLEDCEQLDDNPNFQSYSKNFESNDLDG